MIQEFVMTSCHGNIDCMFSVGVFMGGFIGAMTSTFLIWLSAWIRNL